MWLTTLNVVWIVRHIEFPNIFGAGGVVSFVEYSFSSIALAMIPLGFSSQSKFIRKVNDFFLERMHKNQGVGKFLNTQNTLIQPDILLFERQLKLIPQKFSVAMWQITESLHWEEKLF